MKDRLQRLGTVRIWIFAMLGGILFAAFDRCGYMLKRYGSIWAVSENPWHRTVFHRIALRLPVSVLAVFLLLLLTDILLGKNGGRDAGAGSRGRPERSGAGDLCLGAGDGRRGAVSCFAGA